jgi:AhpD family alkylhydroperoxidase
MKARMKNPASILPGSMQAIHDLMASAHKSGAPDKILHLVHQRASHINGCAPCVDSGVKHAREAGVSDEQLNAVAVWREAPFFSEAERAALALADEITWLDRRDPVSDPVWAEAEKHFDQRALAGIVLWVALTNLFNRVNVTTRQIVGSAW